MSHSCPLHNQFGEKLKWSFTTSFGTCVYDIFDEISFIIGWISVTIWTFALLPQIITNYKKKSAESQSFWFWILWAAGDLCNFGGCLMTKNLITNVALAFVYLVLTLIACLQFIWYEYLVKKYKSKNKISVHHQKLNLLLNIDRLDSPNTQTSERRRKLSISSVMYNTPKFVAKYHNQSPHSSTDMSTHLKSTLAILSRSPRMFAFSPQLTPKMRAEYESFQTVQKLHSEHEVQKDEIQINSPDDGDNDDDNTAARVHGKAGTIISTLTSMTVTVVMLYGLQSDSTESVSNYNHQSARVLLQNKNFEDEMLMVGIIIGWIAAFIYIVSRIPQLRLMLKTKDVSGINPLFFGLTFSGNMTQCLSMVISKKIYNNQSDFISKLPWLVTAACCMLEDGFILVIIYLYWKRDRKFSVEEKRGKLLIDNIGSVNSVNSNYR
eukprot:536439_1